MRVPIYTVAIPILAAVAFAQDTTSKPAASGRLDEMKTQSYSGTLMDASCAADKQSCAVSAGTSKFALQLKDGKTVMFDDVGNMRAQEAFKAHKKWSDSAAASKPVRVTASGVLNGDKLTVMSID